MTNLKLIKDNLHTVNLRSLWNLEFYGLNTLGVTPCNSEYYIGKPFRLLYDGIYNDDNGLLLEFTVGVMSDIDSDKYEFFIEDFNSGSTAEHYDSFDEALKRFVKLTNIRKPYIYIDDEHGNAIRIDYKVKPHSTITN